MAVKKGNSLLETRRRNRVLIKNMIFRTKNATRTGIAEALGLTLPTITTSVNEMLAEEILEEVPFPESDLVNAIGRRPTCIAFRAGAGCSVGVELGPYNTHAVLLNMRGDVVACSEEPPAADDYQRMVEELAGQIRRLMPFSDGTHFLGVGIGLPGFADCETGVIHSNPRREWIGQNLAADLRKRLRVPVFVDNNVRLRAIGYEMSSRDPKPDTFAYLFVSHGVACPLMVGGSIVSGFTSGAGELGHTIISVCENGETRRRIVDDLGSERAIFERCQERMERGGAARLRRVLEEKGRLTTSDILDAQREGDPEVCAVMEETVSYLGIALANVVNLINPGFVVVDGLIMGEEINREGLLRAARAGFYSLNEEQVEICFHPYDVFWGAASAAYSAIGRLFLDC